MSTISDADAKAFMEAVARAIEIKKPEILAEYITVGYGVDNGMEKFSLELNMPVGERPIGAIIKEDFERLKEGKPL
jgi:hypothetical protein